ncbi:hypothetical protein [Streptomyces sp. NPDC088733]|uniref:hypothetical protein n=1 Tax=Streptomyces sp. NPDC088733 TaxID=3365880 RepID=UPI00381A2508
MAHDVLHERGHAGEERAVGEGRKGLCHGGACHGGRGGAGVLLGAGRLRAPFGQRARGGRQHLGGLRVGEGAQRVRALLVARAQGVPEGERRNKARAGGELGTTAADREVGEFVRAGRVAGRVERHRLVGERHDRLGSAGKPQRAERDRPGPTVPLPHGETDGASVGRAGGAACLRAGALDPDPSAEDGSVGAERRVLQAGLQRQHLAVLLPQPGVLADAGAEEGGQRGTAVGAGGRVVLHPDLLAALLALAPEGGAVAEDGPAGRHHRVTGVQGPAAGGAAAAGEGDRGCADARVPPRRNGVPAEGEDVGRPGGPVAALLVALPPDDEEFAVGVAEGRLLPAVEPDRDPQVVFEEDLLGSDHHDLVLAGEHEGGPGLGDREGVLPGGLAGGGVEECHGLLQGRPAQFVEDALAQGATEQRRDVVTGDPGDGTGVDALGDGPEGPHAGEGRPGGGQAVGAGELFRRLVQPVVQDGAEHGVRGQGLQHRCLRAVVAELADPVVQQEPQARVGAGGHEVSASGSAVEQPRAERQVDLGRVVGDGQRDALCRAQVQQVEFGAGAPAGREEVDGACVGAQPGCHAGDEGEGGRGAFGAGRAVLAVRGPAGQPVRRVDVRGGVTRLPGQQGVGAGLGEQREPELVVLGAAAESGRHDLQQPCPYGRLPFGEHDEGGPVGGPEGAGRADDGGRGQQVGDEGALLGDPVEPGGLEQSAGVLRQRGVRRHPGRAALHGELAELPPGLGRVEAPGEVLDVLLERLDGEGASEGELQEHGALAVLVDGEAVDALGRTGLAEEGGGIRGVLVLEEDPRGLLVEGGQEVRHGAAEAFGQGLEAVLGGAGTGLGRPGEPFDVLDQGQRVVAVGRVVDQGPGGEAERLAAHLADLRRLRFAGQAEEVQRQVLRLAEGARDEADDEASFEHGVRVAAHGEGVGVLARGGAEGQDRAGVQQGGGGVPVFGGHAACSSSSMSRPAYNAAAMRMPSDQATGPT